MDAEGPLYLVVRDGQTRGTAITIPPGGCVVGAAAEAVVRIEAPGISPRHLAVEVDALGVAWATPIEGAPVSVNGRAIAQRTLLEVGDCVGAGTISLELAAGPWGVEQRDTRVRPNSSPTVHPEQVAAPASIFQPGQLISERYRVLDRLAGGGMGEVFRVQHVELGRVFALKVMRAELSAAPDFVDRFRREAVASSRIGHPNIVDITDFGRTAEGLFYFVMEHLDGKTLGELLGTQGAQSIERVVHLTRQLCSALGAAHAQGIVHRDLKPDNIMVVQRPGAPDMVKVLDFGIAKVDSGVGRGGQTGVGVVVGTPQYMSPEQASGLAIDHRSDLYSLGLILYELLAGRPAFTADTPPLLMMQQISEPPPALPSVLTGKVPVGLERAVFALLAKRPDDRPASMAAVLKLLEDVRLPTPTAAIPPPPLPPMFGAPTEPMPRPQTPTRVDTPRARARTAGADAPRTSVETPGTRMALEAIRASRRQRDRARLAAAVVSLLTFAGAFLWLRRADPAPEQATPPPLVVKEPLPPPAPAVAAPPPIERPRLTVISRPEGAVVLVAGAVRGRTPLSLSVDPGEVVRVQVELAGHVAQGRDLSVDSSFTTEFELLPEPRPRPAAAKRSKPREQLKDPYADDLKELE